MSDSTIEESFLRFHQENPDVYDQLVAMARKAKVAGKTRIGIKRLWEAMRWEMDLRAGSEEFALNNNFTSRYARLIMAEQPDLRGLFETRALRSEHEPVQSPANEDFTDEDRAMYELMCG